MCRQRYTYGALIGEAQLAVTEGHVADAKAKGARVLSHGKRPDGPGSFYPPTMLVDVDHSTACMTEVAEAIRLTDCAGGDSYHNSPKALIRMHRLTTRMAPARAHRTVR